MQIVQQVSTPPGGESFVDIAPVQAGSIVIVTCTVNAMSLSPGNVSATWKNNVGENKQCVVGFGPYDSDTRLQLTPGRTPPKVNATFIEVQP